MAVHARAEAVAPARVRARVSPAVVIGLMVGVSFAARLAFAWARATPNRYPDEYLYAELGRSFARHGLPLVRGHLANFPALLMPLITSPAWLFHDVDVSLRIIQTMGALVMSLAAVPAYLLARRLRLGTTAAFGVAALTLAVPDFIASSYVVAGPYAYPLSIFVTYAGVVALERPSRRRQLVFVALSILAMLTRTQFAITPLAFGLAVVVVGLRERRVRAALREQALALGIFAAGAAALGVVGLGYYSGAFHLDKVASLPHTLAINVLVITFASGWVIVPGALIALALGIARPLERVELIFCVFALGRIAVMLAEAGIYGAQAHERYLVYGTPLLAVAFMLYVRRGFPHRLVHAALAVAFLLLALREPLTSVAGAGIANSAVLLAVSWLASHVSAGSASSILLNVVLVGTLVLLALTRFRRVAAVTAVAFAATLCFALWAAAARFDETNTSHLRAVLLPQDRSWVEARGAGDATLVQAFGGSRTAAFDQLFWNRSVDSVALLPNALPIDAFRTSTIAPRRPVHKPLVVDELQSTVVFTGGHVVENAPFYELWVPSSHGLRLAAYFAGRARNGSLLPVSIVELWRAHGAFSGDVRVVLSTPAGSSGAVVSLPNAHVTIPIGRGRSHALVFRVCSARIWRAAFVVRSGSVRATMPTYRPDSRVCR